MSHNRLARAQASSQGGSMLIMAIFVIIVMSLLGLAVVQILSTSNRSMMTEVYGSRALNAANSGAQLKLEKVLIDDAQCVATLYVLPEISAFHGCEVTVKCRSFTINKFDYNFKHFRIDSTATCTVADFITQRSISLEARKKSI